MADGANSMSERLLVDAVITSGMRVLDIGCGCGEVSLLLAKLVGEGGQVLGIDQNSQSLITAREKVRDQNLSNITFLQSDLSGPLSNLGPFDAAVGRRVLMYLPNPVDAIRYIAAAVRRGGIVVFQEIDSTPDSQARCRQREICRYRNTRTTPDRRAHGGQLRLRERHGVWRLGT